MRESCFVGHFVCDIGLGFFSVSLGGKLFLMVTLSLSFFFHIFVNYISIV